MAISGSRTGLARSARGRCASQKWRTASPLAGLPVGVKDIIDTAEYPTAYGCQVFKGNFPSTDANVVGELKRAGAIILGKTVTTELAFFGPGKTRNPHNIEHTPGGLRPDRQRPLRIFRYRWR